MNYYRVNLYIKADGGLGTQNVGRIIVKKTALETTEIYTGRKMRVSTNDEYLNLVEKDTVFIVRDDFEMENLVSLDEVRYYINTFDEESFYDNFINDKEYLKEQENKNAKKKIKQKRDISRFLKVKRR